MKIQERGIKISPNYYQEDWKNLNFDDGNSDDWQKAIEIFNDRMQGRFLKQIKVLDENPDREIACYSGFAIMSLVCVFIETIDKFWMGKTDSNLKVNTWSLVDYFLNKGKNMDSGTSSFYRFFKKSKFLGDFFNSRDKAYVFYRDFRCGLIHKNKTKGESLIHIKKGSKCVEWIDKSNYNKGLIINRKLFVEEIISIYDTYIESLKNINQKSTLKNNFKKTMDEIVYQIIPSEIEY